MYRQPLPTHPRRTWRVVQRMARNLDRQMPHWWQRDPLIYNLLNTHSERVNRCWRELIRQRTGE